MKSKTGSVFSDAPVSIIISELFQISPDSKNDSYLSQPLFFPSVMGLADLYTIQSPTSLNLNRHIEHTQSTSESDQLLENMRAINYVAENHR